VGGKATGGGGQGEWERESVAAASVGGESERVKRERVWPTHVGLTAAWLCHLLTDDKETFVVR